MTIQIDLIKALRCPIYRAELARELEGGVTDMVMHEAADEIERQRTRIAELEVALRPFAQFHREAERVAKAHPDAARRWMPGDKLAELQISEGGTPSGMQVTARLVDEDFRRARAALGDAE